MAGTHGLPELNTKDKKMNMNFFSATQVKLFTVYIVLKWISS